MCGICTGFEQIIILYVGFVFGFEQIILLDCCMLQPGLVATLITKHQ